MSELAEKVKTSIDRLRTFEPKNGEGYYLAFSGGKDSVACKALMDMAGVKYDATYRVTSVDPPELVQFIKDKHPDVKREIPHYKDGKPITMWNLIPKKLMPPTRHSRYCCEYLKESSGDGRMVVTGVRWAESATRKEGQGIITIRDAAHSFQEKEVDGISTTKYGGVVLTNDNIETRKMVEQCYKRRKTTVNPIIDWSEDEVWAFIKAEGIPYCGLYDNNFRRLGCIGCPLAGSRDREKEFLYWPKYKDAYLRSFEKMLERRRERNRDDPCKPVWKRFGIIYKDVTVTDVWNAWMEYDVLPGQIDLFEEE